MLYQTQAGMFSPWQKISIMAHECTNQGAEAMGAVTTPAREANNLILIQIIMINLPDVENQIYHATDFKSLVSTPFQGAINAICWKQC